MVQLIQNLPALQDFGESLDAIAEKSPKGTLNITACIAFSHGFYLPFTAEINFA